MLFKRILLACIFVVSFTSTVQANETGNVKIIHAGTLLAIPGRHPTEKQSIIIEDDRIREIRDGYVTASEVGGNAEIIDLSSNFIMPGFIDCHVHLYADGVDLHDENDPFYTEHSFLTDAEYALRSIKPAMRTLRQGFTTIRSPGTHGTLAIRDLRDSINAGYIDGPRILSAVSMVEIPGSGDDISVGLRDELMPLRRPLGACANVSECRAVVRKLFQLGADFIKADNQAVSFNPAHNREQTDIPKLTDEEMFAIVDTGHRLGLKVSVHAMGNSVKQALRAGADSIEHGFGMDRSTVNLFKKTNAYLSPTMASMGLGPVKMARDPNSRMPAGEREQVMAEWTAIKKGHSMALKAGVKFVHSTDSGGIKHGQNLQEFMFWKEIGMSPMQAIESATVNSADLLDMSEEIGTIEAGKSADIIAVANNPLSKMENLLDMRFVMARGKVYRND